ncbi:class I SAM-dependent methyltransferase [Alcaligenes aquatilis]|uniref:class I SAM-dependent methyltransferase n=1 Tax=Alcaligenes aquatilis TaxID=323284 RepID=UPI000D52DF33|nr:class I SAM-dependent methyltransferase [Alcaligenes aquatilis]AWG36401.1 SAM-dependent methyltransferase [Alcaligenes aquatilis]
MERLDLSARPEHSTQESTIHLARYASILPFVKDKVVLDIACGEGYGSALMMRAGAKRVVGVDISAEAVAKSQKVFADSKAEYIQADVTRLEELFEPGTFDVVVSIETIEHVTDDETYLIALKRAAKPDAVFLISCPNDHWYYPQPDQANPFHLRKYRLEEFQAVSTKVLGNNVHWGVGSAVFGFGTAPLEKKEFEPLYDSWMKANQVGASFVVENDELEPLGAQNSSYFMGIWNAQGFSYGAAYFGVGMDAYARMFDALAYDSVKSLKFALNDEVSEKDALALRCKELEQDLDKIVQELEQENREVRNKTLLLAAVQSENKLIRENINGLWDKICLLEGTVSEMQTGYWRYRRISDKVPESLRRAVIKCVRAFKR